MADDVERKVLFAIEGDLDNEASSLDCESRLIVELEACKNAKQSSSEQAEDLLGRARAISCRDAAMSTEKEQLEEQGKQCVNEFLRHCKSVELVEYKLTLVRLHRNDDQTSIVNARNFPQGYGVTLGAALLNNTNVHTLRLNPKYLLPSDASQVLPALEDLANFVATSTSLSTLDAGLSPFQEQVPLVQEIADLLLGKVSRNKRIENVIWAFPVKPLEFSCYVGGTNTLQTLDIKFFGDYSVNDGEAIAAGFEDSENVLKRLKIYVEYTPTILVPILSNLHLVSSLQELVVVGHHGMDKVVRVVDAIAQYFNSATRPLGRLTLVGFDSRVHAIAIGNAVARAALDEFAFVEMLQPIEIDDFATVLQTRISATAPVHGGGGLRKLCLLLGFGIGVFDEASSRHLADSLLEMEVDGQLVPTVGSRIHTLEISNVHPSFFRHLSTNADRVRLQRLSIYDVREPATAEAFAECLPRLGSLFELHLVEPDARTLSIIARGFSGTVSFGGCVHAYDPGDGVALSPTQNRLIPVVQAHCDRNRLLGDLMATGPQMNANIGEETHDGGDGDQHMQHDNVAAGGTAVARERASFYPGLLVVVTQVPNPSRCATMFHQSLLQLGPCLGSERDADDTETESE